MSIRGRLALSVALLLLVTLTVLGAVIVAMTRATLVDQIDARVLAAADRAVPRGGFMAMGGARRGDDDEAEGHGDPDDHPGDAMGRGPLPPAIASPEVPVDADGDPFERPIARFVFAPDGTRITADLSGYPDAPDPPPRLPDIQSRDINRFVGRIVTLRSADSAHAYRVLVQRGDNGVIVVTAAPLDSVEAAVRRVVQAFLLFGGIALAAAALASWGLIRVGLRPVDRMVETAAAIAAGDLSRRVVDADPRSELGRLGSALNEMLARIEQALQARAASEERLRRFVADAAHELRTPLTSLRGYAELYRQGALPTPEAVARAMGRIEGEGARMARLVDDLLLLARLDQQRGLEREPVDLAAIVRDAAADFAAVEPDRPFTHHLDGAAVVLGDRLRLRQVVDNLLANARTHTPPGTPVRVAVRRTDREVEVVVADEGPGIPPELQPKVFERFWRADPNRARTTGGTGLGLAIVDSLVRAHGGTIGLASAPGQGTTFTVRLPLA